MMCKYKNCDCVKYKVRHILWGNWRYRWTKPRWFVD